MWYVHYGGAFSISVPPVSPTPNASLFQDREEYDRQIRQFFERMGEESSTKQWAAAGSGGSDLAASLQSRQLS